MIYNDFGLVSIIMAAYNAEKTIGFAIESVLNQSYADFELIVINDCSSDGTRKIVKSFVDRDPRVKLIDNEKNSGVSVTRLNGIKAALGNWIAILDSDDAWLPEKLEKQIALQAETNADILYTGVSYIDEFGNPYKWTFSVPESVGYRKLLEQNLITNSSALVRKELILNHYASGDSMHEDFALWLRLLKAGYTACGVNEPLTVYRLSANSKSGNKLKSAIMNWRTYRYAELNPFASAYYMCRYTVNGLRKYKNLKREDRK